MFRLSFFWLFTWFIADLSAQCTFEKHWSYFPYNDIHGKIQSIVLSDGGYLLAGVAHSDSMDVVDGTEPNMLLIKTDACGKTLWVNDAGYPEDGDSKVELIETDDNHYLMVSNNGFSGVRIGKYNTKGLLVKESWLTVGNNRVSDVMGLLKRTGIDNRFVVFVSNYNPGGQNSVPYLVEIDEDLNIKRSYEYFYGNEFSPKLYTGGTCGFLFGKDSLSYIGIMSYENGATNEDTVVLVELDTTFLIKSFVYVGEDSLVEYGWYEDGLVLSADGQTLTGGGQIQYKKDIWPQYKEALIQVDVKGYLKNVVYLDDSISFTWYFKQTLDGGYIKNAGAGLMKLDSSLTIKWIKSTSNVVLTSLNLLDDGGFVGGGSWFFDINDPEAFPRICLARTDSLGDFIRTGTEKPFSDMVGTVEVFPNPTHGMITIQSPFPYHQMSVFSSSGQLVYESEATTDSLNMLMFEKGLYFLTLQDAHGRTIHTQKLSIQ